MVRLFSFVVLISFSLLSFSIFSSDLNLSVLNLSQEKEIEFNRLPKSVQTLMLNEAQYAKNVRAFNARKSTGDFSKNLKTDCDDRENRRDHGNYDHRDHDEYRCVPNCTWRRSDGSCISYGADFCGNNATCVKNCTWRASDGHCNNYEADLCM